MKAAWWQLPGPSRFVNRVAQDLQDGTNVIICLPLHFPDGLARAVRAQVEVYESWPWYTIALDTITNANPADFLYAMFVQADTPNDLCTAATLVREDIFAGRIIWVNGITTATWTIWHQFIAEYTHACRMRSPTTRTVFVLPLVGDLARTPPLEDIGLAVHTWRAVVSRLDMLLFTAGSLPDQRVNTSLERQMVIACVANIALWDPLIAEELIEQPLMTILQPQRLLAEFARQRCWGELLLTEDAWCQGVVDQIDGVDEMHSAICIDELEQRKIERRIWAAQVGTLFPFVEEQRQNLLTRLRHYLRTPFITPEGATIEDLQDLEINHIYWQLTELRRQGVREASINLDRVINRVNNLRLIRNDLAHLKCITAERFQLLREQ
jgi:hypothetical protein